NAYFVLGTNEFGTDYYRRAADLYREILATTSPDDDPMQWSTVHQTLGLALGGIGYREQDMASMDAAVEALETALTFLDPKTHPGDVAKAEYELGGTLVQMAIIGGDITHAEEGVTTLRLALRRADAMDPFDAALANQWLGTGHVILARENPDLYAEAITAFEAVLPAYPPETYPVNWASTVHSLAHAQHSLAESRGDETLLRTALENYDRAGTILTRQASPPEWAAIAFNKGTAWRNLGDLTADPQHYRAAIASWTESRETYRESGTTQYEDWFAEAIAEAEGKVE
uniref:hypothetical protein n=1 Tax=Shinella sp. TaxID=1870904 RepID=UPI003F708F98